VGGFARLRVVTPPATNALPLTLCPWTRARSLDEAEHFFDLALKASPLRPPTDHAYVNLASIYRDSHRPKQAIRAYEAALTLTASQQVRHRMYSMQPRS